MNYLLLSIEPPLTESCWDEFPQIDVHDPRQPQLHATCSVALCKFCLESTRNPFLFVHY